MRSIGVMVAIVAAAVLTAAGPASAGTQRVARVVDGDTVVLTSGRRVRLVQIDSPETHGSRECYGTQAASALAKLLPRGTAVRLVRDPRLDDRDRYGRLLRYVFKGGLNVNLRLVARGDATVWFFEGDRGRYAGKLLAAQRRARAGGLGLWKACPAARVDPLAAASTGSLRVAAPKQPTGGSCEAGYRPCLPVRDDIDCGEIADSLKPIHVSGTDPYRLDADHDGVGCEP
jgi:endonuclease YncB( thermonuclease family)